MTKSPFDTCDTYIVANDGSVFNIEDIFILSVHPQDQITYNTLDCGSDAEIVALAETQGEPLSNLFDD